MARTKKRLWGFDDSDREILINATAEIPELRAVIARAAQRAELGKPVGNRGERR